MRAGATFLPKRIHLETHDEFCFTFQIQLFRLGNKPCIFVTTKVGCLVACKRLSNCLGIYYEFVSMILGQNLFEHPNF